MGASGSNLTGVFVARRRRIDGPGAAGEGDADGRRPKALGVIVLVLMV